jgi:hypothetical protein
MAGFCHHPVGNERIDSVSLETGWLMVGFVVKVVDQKNRCAIKRAER